jgi:hypothetical protein
MKSDHVYYVQAVNNYSDVILHEKSVEFIKTVFNNYIFVEKVEFHFVVSKLKCNNDE